MHASIAKIHTLFTILKLFKLLRKKARSTFFPLPIIVTGCLHCLNICVTIQFSVMQTWLQVFPCPIPIPGSSTVLTLAV